MMMVTTTKIFELSRAVDLSVALIWSLLMVAGVFNLLLYCVGFVIWIRDRRRPVQATGCAEVWSRTAIVMPIYHEDTDRVRVAVAKTWRSAKEAGLHRYCDFYLLCDSTDAVMRAAEDELFNRLLAEFSEGVSPRGDRDQMGGLFLIRRDGRRNYKAGNIANFLEKHGGAYDFMLVLDADSVMMGETIQRMILRMQASPKLGILQSTIVPAGAISLFARSMQFSLQRTMPLYARGLYWFFRGQSVYWGHNALIRIAPFVAHANLPVMPGRPPLGGAIMSQDIVEAALLGRTGWAVEWDVHAGGSFDEIPANILTYGKRDRRWCQGNFQHFWLIFGDGIRLGHRLYFGNGILSYLTGPLLLVLLLLGFVRCVLADAGTKHAGFDGRYLLLLLLMLGLPRLLGLVRTFYDERRVMRISDACRELLSMSAEFVLTVIVAPSLFYLHTRFVLEILGGRQVNWGSQSRNPCERLSVVSASRLLGPATLIGLIWSFVAISHAPGFLFFLAPMLAGWLLAIPVAVATSSPEVGERLISMGLFPDLRKGRECRSGGIASRSIEHVVSAHADGLTVIPQK